MKASKLIFILHFIFTCSIPVFSQTPRIALVKPNGATTIHSTILAAYDAASDDDCIYLPGGTFDNSLSLNKRIHIYGAGYNIDSCQTTGITVIGQILINNNAANGSIQGIKINYLSFENEGDGFHIKRCLINNGIQFNTNLVWNNIIIENNFIKGYSANQGYSYISLNGQVTNSVFKNNVILGNINGGDGLLFKNNLFFYQGLYPMNLASNSTYNNNIYVGGSISVNNSIFNNNVNLSGSEGANNQNYNLIYEPFPEIFENSGLPPYFPYDVHNDYHVKSSSACKNSGTDGTDRGIYGGTSPWVEGSVPSNPHIYFKQVAEETNASGQLQIHF
ncbi:MAG TPA: hypothetical protein PJ990_21575, partial [Saprospiraceae bacterium]|nr:hypothetical protein [Saprospiraceae bacterium]